MGTIFFIIAAVVVWSIAKSKSDENDDQRRLDDLRRRLRQQGSQPLDRPFEPGVLRGLEGEADERPLSATKSSEPEGDGANGRWSAWLDPEGTPGQAGTEALPSEPPGSTFPQQADAPPLERLRQGLGFPENTPEGPDSPGHGLPSHGAAPPAEPESPGVAEVESAPAIEPGVAFEPQPQPQPEPEPEPEPQPEPEPEPIPALSDGAPPDDPDADLAERFERALEQRSAAYAERGGPAPVELSISSSLVRPMGDLLSVLVNLEGGGAKHLTAQSRGLPVFGLRLAKPAELTEARLVDALDHLERAHPTLRRGCAERLIGALSGVRHARPAWTQVLDRLVGERD